VSEINDTEKYFLSQILVCGAIDEDEFCRMNSSLSAVQQSAISELHENGVLEHTRFVPYR